MLKILPNQRVEPNHRRTFYGGEALPIWHAGYSGVSAIPALLGCRTEVDMATG